MNLPALSDKRWLRFTVFTAYYVMQGLPIGLIFIAFPAWFTAQGIEKEWIASFAAIAGLPWALKLIAGPFIDRFTFRAMGLRRPWILGTQGLLLLSASAFFFVTDLQTQFWWIVAICTAMNTFAATEDVAVDGLAIVILPENERGRANAFMGGGQVAGISLTGAVASTLLNAGGVQSVALFLVLAIGALMTLTIVIRERPGERMLPWTAGEAHPDSKVAGGTAVTRTKELAKALLLPMSMVILFSAFVSSMPESMFEIWGPEMAIKQFGFSDTNYAHWVSIALLVSAFLGLIFGPVVDRIGVVKAYRMALLTNVAVYAVYYFLVPTLANPIAAITALFITQFVKIIAFISAIAIFMFLCRKSISATQFACYMAILNLGRSLGSYLYPKLSDFAGLDGMFLVLSGLFAAAWVISRFFNLDTHKRHLSERFKGLQEASPIAAKT